MATPARRHEVRKNTERRVKKPPLCLLLCEERVPGLCTSGKRKFVVGDGASAGALVARRLVADESGTDITGPTWAMPPTHGRPMNRTRGGDRHVASLISEHGKGAALIDARRVGDLQRGCFVIWFH
jgi:hypothetical protein